MLGCLVGPPPGDPRAATETSRMPAKRQGSFIGAGVTGYPSVDGSAGFITPRQASLDRTAPKHIGLITSSGPDWLSPPKLTYYACAVRAYGLHRGRVAIRAIAASFRPFEQRRLTSPGLRSSWLKPLTMQIRDPRP
jgi:hypothetical protein